MARTTRVSCAQCGYELDEPTHLLPAKREPCASCGSLARAFEVGLSDRLTTPAAAFKVSEASPRLTLTDVEDAGFRLSLLKLDEAWMVQAFDAADKLVAVSIQDDPHDAIVAIVDQLHLSK